MTAPEDPVGTHSSVGGPTVVEGASPGAGIPAGETPGQAGAESQVSEDTRRRRLRSAIEWVAVLAGAVVVALLVRTFLFTTFWIPSGSMEPTLSGEHRDRVVVNRLSYKLHDVGRGDIIVFDVPEGEAQMTVEGQQVEQLIKRVVGLEGETVELRNGDVYIDGKKLDEPYLPEGTTTEPCPGVEQATFEVPEDSVFVMGDNRDFSHDARCWPKHYVPEDDIVGRAFVRIWPLNDIGGI